MSKKIVSLVFSLSIVIFVVLMFPKYSYNDPDTFWHIELGNYMLDHHTILHHAIHTFYNDRLPYVPHEFGFQIMVALLYRAFGWPGLYLLAAACLFMLITGMLRLMRVSRKEIGIHTDSPLMVAFVVPRGGRPVRWQTGPVCHRRVERRIRLDGIREIHVWILGIFTGYREVGPA